LYRSNVPESHCFAYLLQHGGQLVAHPIFGFGFLFFSPERRRVAEAGQGMSARTV
jgi:hypothetical protein